MNAKGKDDLAVEFQRLQVNGYLGDFLGKDAYGYGRASTENQVEEGSSFPRQIENIHKAALRDGLRIAFNMLFFDDGYSGFEFHNRPALTKLRKEISTTPRAHHIVFEDIDRLSRNSNWHQGMLLDEFKVHKVEVHFWVQIHSEIERQVRGFVAQEGMKKDQMRLVDGVKRKAKEGKITARTAKFGYRLTDHKNSHYEKSEDAQVVVMIYNKINYENYSLNAVAKFLNDSGIKSPMGKLWFASSLYKIVTSTVYKGEFYANRVTNIRTGKYSLSGKPLFNKVYRPREEWILVRVPAIVTPEEWDLAQEKLKRNTLLSTRNERKQEWLLQGFCKCGVCKEYTFVSRSYSKRYYQCGSSHSERRRLENTVCKIPHVRAEVIETLVWGKIEEVIFNPELIIKRLEEKESEVEKSKVNEQIVALDKQVEKLVRQREKLKNAFDADIYTLEEFKDHMAFNKGQIHELSIERAKLETRLQEASSIDEKKKAVVQALQRLKKEVAKSKSEGKVADEIPFQLKRAILKLLVEKIWINTVDKTCTIDGEIKGTYDFDGFGLNPLERGVKSKPASIK